MRVIETFELERGVVVAVEASHNLPAGKRLHATVTLHNGTTITSVAFKERLLRRDPKALETDAVLLCGLRKPDVPVGSEVAFALSSIVATARTATIANKFRALGWSSSKALYTDGHDESYEYLLEWHRAEEPVYPSDHPPLGS